MSSLGGTIDVKSTQGHGTRVQVSIPVVHAPAEDKSLIDADEFVLTRQRSQGTSASLLVPGIRSVPVPNGSAPSPGYEIPSLKSSIPRVCKDWFGIDLRSGPSIPPSDSTICLIVETSSNFLDLKSGNFSFITKLASASAYHNIPLIVMLCRSAQSSYSLASSFMSRGESVTGLVIEYITQPYINPIFRQCVNISANSYPFSFAPRKFARALSLGLARRAKLLETRNNPQLAGPETDIPQAADQAEDEQPATPILSSEIDPMTTSAIRATSSDTGVITSGRQVSDIDTKFSMVAAREIVVHTQPIESQATKLVVRRNTTREPFLLVDDNPINLKVLHFHSKLVRTVLTANSHRRS